MGLEHRLAGHQPLASTQISGGIGSNGHGHPGRATARPFGPTAREPAAPPRRTPHQKVLPTSPDEQRAAASSSRISRKHQQGAHQGARAQGRSGVIAAYGEHLRRATGHQGHRGPSH